MPIATAAVALGYVARARQPGAGARPSSGAIGLFVLSYLGIAISLYPMIVPHHFTLWEAASSERTQAFLLVGTLVLLPVILMYTAGPIGCSAARFAATSAITKSGSRSYWLGAYPFSGVTRGLDPRVHPLRKSVLQRRWIAGSSPAMTEERVCQTSFEREPL